MLRTPDECDQEDRHQRSEEEANPMTEFGFMAVSDAVERTTHAPAEGERANREPEDPGTNKHDERGHDTPSFLIL